LFISLAALPKYKNLLNYFLPLAEAAGFEPLNQGSLVNYSSIASAAPAQIPNFFKLISTTGKSSWI
jgi:hypothetical protein